MMRALSSSLNPFSCCCQSASDADQPLDAGWMREFHALAGGWLDELRRHSSPSWGEPFFERGGGAWRHPIGPLLDTLSPHFSRFDKRDSPSLLALRAPTGPRELDALVDQLQGHEVKSLIVLGDIETPSLWRHELETPTRVVVGHGETARTLIHTRAQPWKESWTSSLTIESELAEMPVDVDEAPDLGLETDAADPSAAPAPLRPAPAAAQEIQVLHLTPVRPGLLSPDDLRHAIDWITAQRPSMKGVRIGILGTVSAAATDTELPGMVGQLALCLALKRRHPGRHPCPSRGGPGADAPLRQAIRELHTRHAGLTSGGPQLCAVAAYLRDVSHDSRVSKALRRPSAADDRAPTSEASDEPLPHWQANTQLARATWRPVSDDDASLSVEENTSTS